MPVTGQAGPPLVRSSASKAPVRARWAVAAVGGAVLILAVSAGIWYTHRPPPPTLAGKWTGDIVWDSATGSEYRQPMRTALFFFPQGHFGTVLTFPTGEVGGSGTYTLRGDRLTVQCLALNLNGHDIPTALFASRPWYQVTARYVVTFPNSRLVLTPVDPGPVSAPGYPLLTTTKPLTFGRVESAAAVVAPPPRE